MSGQDDFFKYITFLVRSLFELIFSTRPEGTQNRKDTCTAVLFTASFSDIFKPDCNSRSVLKGVERFQGSTVLNNGKMHYKEVSSQRCAATMTVWTAAEHKSLMQLFLAFEIKTLEIKWPGYGEGGAVLLLTESMLVVCSIPFALLWDVWVQGENCALLKERARGSKKEKTVATRSWGLIVAEDARLNGSWRGQEQGRIQ